MTDAGSSAAAGRPSLQPRGAGWCPEPLSRRRFLGRLRWSSRRLRPAASGDLTPPSPPHRIGTAVQRRRARAVLSTPGRAVRALSSALRPSEAVTAPERGGQSAGQTDTAAGPPRLHTNERPQRTEQYRLSIMTRPRRSSIHGVVFNQYNARFIKIYGACARSAGLSAV